MTTLSLDSAEMPSLRWWGNLNCILEYFNHKLGWGNKHFMIMKSNTENPSLRETLSLMALCGCGWVTPTLEQLAFNWLAELLKVISWAACHSLLFRWCVPICLFKGVFWDLSQFKRHGSQHCKEFYLPFQECGIQNILKESSPWFSF